MKARREFITLLGGRKPKNDLQQVDFCTPLVEIEQYN